MKRIGVNKEKSLEILEKAKTFSKGDKVKIDYEKIKDRFDTLSEAYVQFIENNTDTVFTITPDENYKGFWTFDEDKSEEKWMFSSNDLIKINEEE